MLKFENLAEVNDRIRAYDFYGNKEAYIEGYVVNKGQIKSPEGFPMYKGYTIHIDTDTIGDRITEHGYIPFETSLEYDDRIIVLEKYVEEEMA